MLLRPIMDIDTRQTLFDLPSACAAMRAAARRSGSEMVSLDHLSGRTLAAPVVAAVDLPTWANSSLDGYAVRVVEVLAGVPVAFEVLAGDDPPALPPGAAAAIATGGLVPAGADAVVPVERAIVEDGRVRVEVLPAPGDGIRGAGADVVAGTAIVPTGVRLGPVAVSAIAAAGLATASCVRRPRVAVLTTGDELVAPGTPLRRGQIHDSNTSLIVGTLEGLGCEIISRGRVPDTLAASIAVFGTALAADIVVSSGGVSVGPRDHVKPALAALGVEELFWRVAIQPGKPVWAGRAPSGTVVVGLPGNPLSTLVALHLLVAPLVRAMLGSAEPPVETAVLGEPVRRLGARLRALPALLASGIATPIAGGSHQIARAAGAGVLALVAAGAGEAPAGAVVPVVRL
jgi:molybdopterin molybdotransferase